MTEYTAYLRGLNFRPHEAKELAAGLEVGTSLLLRREPTNEHDPNAIQVIHVSEDGNETFIGYVAKEVAADLSPELEAFKEAYTCTIEANSMKTIILNIVVGEDDDDQSDID